MKRVASSAYIETLKAFLYSSCKCSITNKKSIGDKGSPCIRPLQ
jgi:hypothetical protein